MSAFGNGSNSNGQFWFGGSTFPGFLYKRNLGVGGRRSTKMTPGGNITCNSSTYLYNKYKPGSGGVGASSTSNRRAKNRLATVCDGQKCFPCYPTLGQYSNYTGNPNGFILCPNILPTFKTITYNGNNNTGGSVPVDGSSPYISGANITVLGNTGNLTKAVDAFIGWNTVAGGTGISYVGGNTFELNVNTILYAQYTIPFLTTGGSTVTYTNSIYVITFTTDGTMTFKSGITMPTTINYLFVGGGGSGGSDIGRGGGGGGAGGQVLYTTNVLGSTPTTTLTFDVAGAVAVANGNPTICSGPGITTITATGGLKGDDCTTNTGAVGGVGTSGGGSGGTGGFYRPANPFADPPVPALIGDQGTPGSPGSSYTINGTVYYFSGGGAGGNNSTGSPAGGRGGGGGSGGGGNGNNAVNPYTGPNGISQSSPSGAGYINSGGGGGGANGGGVLTNGSNGGSGLVVVWFSYP